MREAKYLVGIDLGTSNCAVAYTEPARGAEAPVVDFAIEQLQRPGETAARPLLPSCLYLPGEHELAAGTTRMPWGEQPELVVGEFARWQGARVPGRLISSAKSWLCHGGVDRSAAILPWGAPAEVRKLSPVEASARLLAHLAQAWNFAHPDAPLPAQEVIITVPASFDEAARALTVQAAAQAGLEKFKLVEEPQAAFYDFTARHRQDMAQALEGVRLVLVVDVGGGTSDFTLVETGPSPEGPLLRRIAVGEHLMLGGDNMDAALGRKAEERLLAKAGKLSTLQWNQLTHAARVAKEKLLAGTEPAGRTQAAAPHGQGEEKYNLSVAAEGSRLIGGALSTHLTRGEVEQIILEGFFPVCRPQDKPQQSARTGLQELGLPYAQDAAITRHLAAFLRAHAAAGFAALGQQEDKSRLPRPDALLLNGGVFNSPQITARLLAAVSSWWPEAPPMRLLRHDSLELAVARGAAFYGLTRRGLGRRIGGGAAHALYVGLEKAGSQEPLALCLLPRGQEEGETVELGGRVFRLAVGKPVQFPLFSTASDRLERVGDVVPITEELQPLPPIHTVLKGGGTRSGTVPVHLRATLTELGTLELWCVSQETGERWRLEFELRGISAQAGTTVIESMPPGFAEARLWVERIYGGKASGRATAEVKGTPPKDAKQLWSSLERTLGPREDWRPPVLRELWGTMFAGAARRRRSAEHERICFQLLGYTLRPGFGYPLDDWRCEQLARLFGESVEFHQEKAVWKEFWILWRRIAGGLSEARHQGIWETLKPHLAQRVPPHPPRQQPKPKGAQPEGTDEMVRLAASLEHLPAAEKGELGEWIVARLRRAESASGPWTWALGRLGARLPIYGSVHRTLPPEQARAWIKLLLEPKVSQAEGALFALAQLGRLTGDRARDVDDATRAQVLAKLQSAGASPTWERMVREVVVLDASDKARALGDTLPAGLSIT